DPRDKTDGTVWDALHTAIRGRAAAVAASTPALVAPTPVAPLPSARRSASPPAAEHVLLTAGAMNGNAHMNGRSNGNGHLASGWPTEVIPAGVRTIRIDAPTMVIPAHEVRRPADGNDATTIVRPGQPATVENATSA